jgi:tRNA(Met) cytidine acetyltransferase
MLVQSLAQHGGLEGLPQRRLLRVMRIAVQASCRRRGIGSGLLAQARQLAAQRGFGLLGSAFAVEAGMLAFWRGAGFAAVRLGLRVERSSGTHSLQMLSGVDAAGKHLVDAAQRQFLRDWPWRLLSDFSILDSALAVALLMGRDCDDLPLEAADRLALAAFAQGQRTLADVRPAVWRWLLGLAAAGRLDSAHPGELALLRCVLQGQPFQEREGGRSGEQVTLRQAVKKLLDAG